MISPTEIRLGGNITGSFSTTNGRSVNITMDAPAIVLTGAVLHFAEQASIVYKGTVDSDGVAPWVLTSNVRGAGNSIQAFTRDLKIEAGAQVAVKHPGKLTIEGKLEIEKSSVPAIVVE